jgi:hypothetical protein
MFGRVMFAAWENGMPVSSQLWNPDALIVTEYVDGWTAAKLKNPLEFATVSRVS